jgi:hypothetical protein
MRSEISRRIFPVKRSKFLATLLGALSLLSTSCGTGDKIGSVSMQVVGAGTGVVNLIGLGGTLQLQVLAIYTSGKQIDETNYATYTVTPEGTDDNGVALPSPPQTMTINATGMVTAVDPAVCTWVNLGPSATQPSWAYTGDYMVTATYRGFTSNPVFVPLASAASSASNTNGQCGPAATAN